MRRECKKRANASAIPSKQFKFRVDSVSFFLLESRSIHFVLPNRCILFFFLIPMHNEPPPKSSKPRDSVCAIPFFSPDSGGERVFREIECQYYSRASGILSNCWKVLTYCYNKKRRKEGTSETGRVFFNFF